MTNANPLWHVIYTRPRHEKKVVTSLDSMKIEHFLPTVKTLKVYGGKKKYVTLPLFPSYVFVKPATAQLYLESLHIPGVLQYVKTGKEIAHISESIIYKLRAVDTSTHSDLLVSEQYFSPGKILNISAGPFTGFSCEVVQHHGKHKILVRIELLKRSLLLDISDEHIMSSQ